MRAASVSLADYRRPLRGRAGALLDAERDAPVEYHDRFTVAKTFSLAIDEAAKLHPAAEPLIYYAALLPPEPIPLFLFSEAREKFGEPLASDLAGDGLDEAVAALRAFALVDRETIADERDPAVTTETIRLHRLVRAVAADRFDGEAAEAARRVVIEAMAAVYPPTGVRRPEHLAPRAAARRACARSRPGTTQPPTGAETAAGISLDRLAAISARGARGLCDGAAALRAGAGDPREDARPRASRRPPQSLNKLARLLQDQGDLAGARPLFERALAINEKALGPEHPDTAANLNNLARLLRAQGDLAGARPLFERALAISEKVLGPEHPETAISLNNLALLLRPQGDHAGARPLFDRALAIRERALGPDHPDTAGGARQPRCPASDAGRPSRRAAAL